MIPAIDEMGKLPQWVAYSRNKMPINPHTGKEARTNDSDTWGTLEQAKYIRRALGLPGVGFVFVKNDPYVGIDLDDVRDPETGEVEAWAERIIEKLGSYTEISPSGKGLHILARGDIDRGVVRKVFDSKVEMYDKLRYFTVTGNHYESTPDTIQKPKRLRKLFEWCVEGRERRDYGEEPGEFQTPPASEWIEDALACISADDYHDWVRVGMALRTEFGNDGYPFFDSWSQRSTKYKGTRETWRKWKSFPDSSEVSKGTIIYLAEQGGFVLPRLVPDDVDPDFRTGWDEWIEEQDPLGSPTGGDRGLTIEWVDYADAYLCEDPYEPDLIGPRLLGAGDTMVIAGPPKSMKSLVVLDFLRSMALGRPWLAFEPERPLTIAMLQFELKADAMRRRIDLAPLEEHDVEALRGRFVYTPRFVPMLGPELVAEVSEGLSERLQVPPDILVVDPIANIFTGDNENDNTQMIGFLRQLYYLRNEVNPDAALLLVHHASKKSKEERTTEPFNAIRGATSLRGSYDSSFYVEKHGSTVQLWSELRNGPGLEPYSLSFRDGQFREGSEDLADRIVQAILSDADDGVAFTKSRFVQLHHEELGVDPKSLGANIRNMVEDETLCLFKPTEAHGVKMHPQAHGLLGVPGMRLAGIPIEGSGNGSEETKEPENGDLSHLWDGDQ